MYEIPSGKVLAAFSGHLKIVYDLCWSRDDRSLLSASSDGTVRYVSVCYLKKEQISSEWTAVYVVSLLVKELLQQQFFVAPLGGVSTPCGEQLTMSLYYQWHSMFGANVVIVWLMSLI